MILRRQPPTVQALYAELLEHAIQSGAERSANLSVPGSFVQKTVRGRTYWYLQTSIGGRKSQASLGPDSDGLRQWIDRVREARELADDDDERQRRLSRMLIEGGARPVEPALLRVLELLEQANVFRWGGVLVGTHALSAYGNMLGVRWSAPALKTHDLDIAQDPSVGIGLRSGSEPSNLPEVLQTSDFAFYAVPGLDPRQASTTFKIRGQELRIDFLTPLYGRESEEPVYLPSLRVSAHPLRMLDYLIEDAQQALIVGRRAAVLVNVPQPARFALHKLWVSSKRETAFRAKRRKDLAQAAMLLEVLTADGPDDVTAAWNALDDRPKVRRTVRRLAATLAETDADTGLSAEAVEEILALLPL